MNLACHVTESKNAVWEMGEEYRFLISACVLFTGEDGAAFDGNMCHICM